MKSGTRFWQQFFLENSEASLFQQIYNLPKKMKSFKMMIKLQKHIIFLKLLFLA